MADVYRDWVLYNTSKAYKNWQEYIFDWTMLNEYNQLVTYYDTVQWQLRTSIVNKWVDVPASAPISDYPWYIDQIQTGAAVIDWLTLAAHNVMNCDTSPRTLWNYSFIDWAAYWCVMVDDWAACSNNYNRQLVCYRKRDWYDIEYTSWWIASSNRKYYDKGLCYKNATSVRYFFLYGNISSWDRTNMYVAQIDWDFTNFTAPVVTQTLSWWAGDTDFSDYVLDTEWFTLVGNETSWVRSVNGTRINDDWYIYLVLWYPQP